MPATVVLFHSTLGLRPAVHTFADHLRSGGHEVHVLDLFDGRVLDTIDEGMAVQEEIGFETLDARATAALDELPEDLVYAGFSMGASHAQYHASMRPGARACVLLSGAEPPEDSWPVLPTTIHAMADDPWFELESAQKIQGAELFLYPGSGHLFLDEDFADYDPGAAALVRERVLDFLGRLP